MTLNYPFNQTELNQYLREAGYDNFSVKSAYSVSDTMYFETRRMKNPRDTVIFSISKKTTNLISSPGMIQWKKMIILLNILLQVFLTTKATTACIIYCQQEKGTKTMLSQVKNLKCANWI